MGRHWRSVQSTRCRYHLQNHIIIYHHILCLFGFTCNYYWRYDDSQNIWVNEIGCPCDNLVCLHHIFVWTYFLSSIQCLYGSTSIGYCTNVQTDHCEKEISCSRKDNFTCSVFIFLHCRYSKREHSMARGGNNNKKV